MPYTIEDADIFARETPTLQDGTTGHRVKRIRSGDLLEFEIYPVYKRPPGGVRAKKTQPTTRKQKNQNEKDAKKRFRRLLEANFGKKDRYVTLTTTKKLEERDLRKLVKNYIARWQRARKKAGLPPGKYMGVFEIPTERMKKTHIHLIMEGGLHWTDGRYAEETLWPHGRTNCRALQPNEDGLEELSAYLMKDPKGRKRWIYSKGLRQPTVTYAYISRREAAKIARDQEKAKEWAEKRAKGKWNARNVQIKYSEYISGAYINVIMRRVQ